MSNDDEELKDLSLPGYQFFTPDLNYNYFSDQNASIFSTPPVVSPSETVATQNTFPTSLMAPAQNTLPSAPVQNMLPNAPAQQTAPVQYSLSDDSPEPTFAERVAAMEREKLAEAAATAKAKADAIAASKADIAASKADIAAARADIAAARADIADIAVAPACVAPGPVQTAPAIVAPVQREEVWNQYVEPSCVPDVFSVDFNFNRSLLKIFWRIDVDHNNRVSKNELALALQDNWFEGDEKTLAKLLYQSYEDISPEAIFCDAGLSVNNILGFGPFAEMAASQLETQLPERNLPDRIDFPKRKNPTKSSQQSLRSLFKK